MKKTQLIKSIFTIVILAIVVWSIGCTSGTSLRNLPPIRPDLDNLPKGIKPISLNIGESGELNGEDLNAQLSTISEDDENLGAFILPQQPTTEEGAVPIAVPLSQITSAKENAVNNFGEQLIIGAVDQETDSRFPEVSLTKDGVTVSISYWRDYELNKKFNRGNSISPFFQTEALHQGDKTDVFFVTITNNRKERILFDVLKCYITDHGENQYSGMTYDDLDERFTMITRISGIMVKNGLQTAKRILLEKQVRTVEDGVPSGATVEGYVPFRQVKMNARELIITIPIEKAPPPGSVSRYQTIEFNFSYKHDRATREMQPPPIRF